MKTHTPGPWQIITESRYDYIHGSDTHGAAAEEVAAVVTLNSADAHLIAAAPDLLAACKAALWIVGACEAEATAAMLRAAIAKAEGGAA